ncbi:MAG: ferrous iron transport protein A [Phycisphaerae bacterium]
MGIPMSSLEPGQSGRVLELMSGGSLRHRLLDLGLIPGTRVERLMNSPIGDPACYRIRGAMIALRTQDAGRIRVAV